MNDPSHIQSQELARLSGPHGWGALRGERRGAAARSPRVQGGSARQPERSPEVIETKATPEGRSRRLH